MGNKSGTPKPSSLQSSPKQSKSSSPKMQRAQKQENKNGKKSLDSVELKTNQILKSEEIHAQRINETQSKEDPINEQSNQVANSQVTQGEAKNLSANEVEDCIEFNLISETNEISSKTSRSLICGINLKVHQAKELRERVPMDLVCVIDDSGSMAGSKAQLVRKSLKYLLKIMNENDRISLISFDSKAKILTPFLRNTESNKQSFKQAIKQIVGRGSTNIEAGVEAGLWMINNRKQKNKVTCMFLLSDGQDDSPDVDVRVEKLIKQVDIKETFIVNSYGYGGDHDSVKMRAIAETHKGGYYYIENVKKVSEWFVLSISGLLSAIGEDVRIRIKQKNVADTKLTLKVAYGGEQLWVKQNLEKGELEMYLPHLVIGDNKFYVFECEFDAKNFELKDATRNLPIFEGELEVKAVKQEMIIRKSSTLSLEFKETTDVNELKNNSDKEFYEELIVTHARAVGGMKIKQATELISKNQNYDEAKQILADYKATLVSKSIKPSNNAGMQHLDHDIDDAIQKCAPKLFRQASFEKMEVIHCQRRNSIMHCEDWNDNQKEVMKKFKNKDICLSDDSCSDDEGDAPSNKKQTQQNLNSRYVRNNSAQSISDDSDEELPKVQNIQQIKQVRRTSLKRSFQDDS